ncbi:GNAT family N-acetyltransferase [Roseibium sp. SCP14]|uniref:GNAT family N-acetyltransferase n=1 Tax=Roseibium sp. SCP14 TaxID=3141375 RepID=UPI00333A1F02
MITTRELKRAELNDIWTIDRSEVIEASFVMENGALVLKPEHIDVPGWSPAMVKATTPAFETGYDGGDWFCGLFDTDQLIGIAVLGNQLFGDNSDFLQLKFLHVGSRHRGQGLGKQLFDAAATEARKRGAGRLYISATPTENTVKFYLGLGCRVLIEPDPALFEEEPEDIHLDYEIGTR